MATYNSEEISLMAPAGAVYSKLSNLDNLRSLLEKCPPTRFPPTNWRCSTASQSRPTL